MVVFCFGWHIWMQNYMGFSNLQKINRIRLMVQKLQHCDVVYFYALARINKPLLYYKVTWPRNNPIWRAGGKRPASGHQVSTYTNSVACLFWTVYQGEGHSLGSNPPFALPKVFWSCFQVGRVLCISVITIVGIQSLVPHFGSLNFWCRECFWDPSQQPPLHITTSPLSCFSSLHWSSSSLATGVFGSLGRFVDRPFDNTIPIACSAATTASLVKTTLLSGRRTWGIHSLLKHTRKTSIKGGYL